MAARAFVRVLVRGGAAWLAGVALLAAGPARAGFEFSDREDGISCAFYDVALHVLWPLGRPGWTDALRAADGARPFARDAVAAGDSARVRHIDVTRLAQAWWTDPPLSDGLLLRLQEGKGADFHSRQAADATLRPQLVLQFTDGRRRWLEATASATLDCSTYKGLGQAPVLAARANNWLALRFDVEAVRKVTPQPPVKAELVLVRVPAPTQPPYRLDVFALRPPFSAAEPMRAEGIAAKHPQDRGIESDPDVLFADLFEGASVDPRWSTTMRSSFELLEADPTLGFKPLSGRAMRVLIPKGRQVGLDMRYRFADHQPAEPDEVYFRYYLRLAPDWLLASEGGKLPGLAGTYGRAGWGGRKWDGRKGWSLRGLFVTPPPKGHPAEGRVLLGTYAYHSTSKEFGDNLPWASAGMAGLIEPNRWVCIEQHLKLNAPGKDDGLLEVWIDGRLALSRPNLRLRDVDALHIEEVWMNFFHGGSADAPADLHAYVDNVVVARRYIGPLAP